MYLVTAICVRNVPKEVEVFRRHVPFWMAPYTLYDGALVICTAPDGELHWDGFDVISPQSAFDTQHSGPGCIMRNHSWMNEIIIRYPNADWFFWNEYDSFSTKRSIPAKILKTPGIWGPLVTNHDAIFSAPRYMNLPMLIHRDSMKTLCAAFDKLSPEKEGGCFDRWITRLMMEQNIPFNDFGRFGFTRGPIANEMSGELSDAMAKGAQFIHGVKTPEIFNICKS